MHVDKAGKGAFERASAAPKAPREEERERRFTEKSLRWHGAESRATPLNSGGFQDVCQTSWETRRNSFLIQVVAGRSRPELPGLGKGFASFSRNSSERFCESALTRLFSRRLRHRRRPHGRPASWPCPCTFSRTMYKLCISVVGKLLRALPASFRELSRQASESSLSKLP